MGSPEKQAWIAWDFPIAQFKAKRTDLWPWSLLGPSLRIPCPLSSPPQSFSYPLQRSPQKCPALPSTVPWHLSSVYPVAPRPGIVLTAPMNILSLLLSSID